MYTRVVYRIVSPMHLLLISGLHRLLKKTAMLKNLYGYHTACPF